MTDWSDAPGVEVKNGVVHMTNEDELRSWLRGLSNDDFLSLLPPEAREFIVEDN